MKLPLMVAYASNVQVKFLSQLLKLEFIYKQGVSIEENFETTLENMKRRGNAGSCCNG